MLKRKSEKNKRNRHKYNRYNKHKYTKYWKSHTKLEVEVPIFAYRLLRQLFKTDSYRVGLLKFPNYPECRYVITYLTSCAISKHEAVFGNCRSEQQIFSRFYFISSNFHWRHILKGKADGMHLKNHLLRRRRFRCFSNGLRQETWFGKW